MCSELTYFNLSIARLYHVQLLHTLYVSKENYLDKLCGKGRVRKMVLEILNFSKYSWSWNLTFITISLDIFYISWVHLIEVFPGPKPPSPSVWMGAYPVFLLSLLKVSGNKLFSVQSTINSLKDYWIYLSDKLS